MNLSDLRREHSEYCMGARRWGKGADGTEDTYCYCGADAHNLRVDQHEREVAELVEAARNGQETQYSLAHQANIEAALAKFPQESK